MRCFLRLACTLVCLSTASASAQEQLIADFSWEELGVLAAADGAGDRAFEYEIGLASGGDEFRKRADRRELIQSLRDEATRRTMEDPAWRAALSSVTLSLSVEVTVPEFDFDDRVFWFCIPSSVRFRPDTGLSNSSLEIRDITLDVDFYGQDSGLYAFIPAMLSGGCSTVSPFRDKYSANPNSDQYSIMVRHRLPVKFEDEAAAERLYKALTASPNGLIETRVKCSALQNPSEGQVFPRCWVTAIEIGRNPDGSAWFTYTYKEKGEWERKDASVFLFPGTTATPAPVVARERSSVATASDKVHLRLSQEEVISIATGILLGQSYGQNETEVHGNIIDVTFATAAPCNEGPAWQVTVHVPATTDADAINGILAINDMDGKPVCIGLPFLDGVELSPLPVISLEKYEPASETETVAGQSTLPDLLQQIADHYTEAETQSGAERANSLSMIRTLLDRVATDYPASNEALSLALGDKVGLVDPVALDAELAAAGADAQKPDRTAVTIIDPTLATLSICFPPTERAEDSDDQSARVTIQVSLDAEGRIVGMPDFIEPAAPDEAARRLFQRIVIALDSCTELKNLSLPAAIEMSLTAAGVESAALKSAAQPSEPPILKAPEIAAEDLPETLTSDVAEPLSISESVPAAEPTWEYADSAVEKSLGLGRSEIAELQVRLKLLGYDPKGIDGVAGKGMRKAISDWQTDRMLPSSGFVDARQLKKLRDETANEFSAWIAQAENLAALDRASKPPKASTKAKGQPVKPSGGRKWYRDERGWYCTRTILGPMCQRNRP